MQLRYKLYEAINCLAGKTLDISPLPSLSLSLSLSFPLSSLPIYPHSLTYSICAQTGASYRSLFRRSDSNRNDIEGGRGRAVDWVH